jgi:hypothetical protein
MKARLVLVAATVIIVGCSSDDGGSTTASTEAEATTAGPDSTAPPVSVVVPAPEISGDNPPRPEELDPPTAPTVCRLLSTDEIAAVFGVEIVGSEEGGNIDDQVGCRFLDPEGDGVVTLILTGPTATPPPAEKLAELQGLPDAIERPDVGDGGVIAPVSVAALFGDHFLELRVLEGRGADVDAQFELLETAASRL